MRRQSRMGMAVYFRVFLVVVALCLSVGAARAQTAAEDIETRREAIAPRPAPLPARPSIQFTSQRPPSNADTIVFQLNGVNIVGSTIYDEAALATTYEGRVGREVKLSEIYEIAGALQALYRNDDYSFTRVLVPAQEIAGGVVRLEVIEATIESIKIEEPAGDIGPVRALIERMTTPLVGKLNPTSRDLERMLISINDIPGVTRATAVPTRGEKGRGALALFINVERDPFEAVVYGDNRQTSAVGRGIVGGTATFSGYTENGDTTSVSYFNSFGYLTDVPGKDGGFGDFDERNTLQVEHSRIVDEIGSTLTGSVLVSRTKPGDDLAQIGIIGYQLLAQAELARPLYRSRAATVFGRVGVEFSNSTTDVSGGAFRVADDRLRVARLSFDGLVRDSAGYTKFDVELRQGLDILNASDAATDRLLSRGDGRGDFTTLRASLEREVNVNDDLSVLLKAGGQYAFTPLLAGEEFSIGGLTYGRGFDPSEFTGDNGFGGSVEFRYRQSISVQDFEVTAEGYGFTEYGVVYNKGRGRPAMADVVTAGGGVRLFLPADYVLGFEMAFPIDQPLERTQSQSGRLFVNFSKRF